jgi:asparagine synthase (glutamine-hydrolysing)
MCGIAGYWSADSRAREVLPRMTAALAHRGPDADGFYYDGPVGLGHRRLSIIDIVGSNQPLVSEDGSIVVIFKGEIYNFRELREELMAAGHKFLTKGDGEVIVHAWRARGERMLEWLTGMFAFALWDRTRQQLFVARDHLGVKPLYYAWHAGTLVFGSELKALLPFPGLPLAIDRDALALYLECQYIPAPNSIYSGIRKLEAGHWLSVRDGALRTGSFWSTRCWSPMFPSVSSSVAGSIRVWSPQWRTAFPGEQSIPSTSVSPDTPWGANTNTPSVSRRT